MFAHDKCHFLTHLRRSYNLVEDISMIIESMFIELFNLGPTNFGEGGQLLCMMKPQALNNHWKN